MSNYITCFKNYISRIVAALRPIDISFLKICCVSFGVLLTALFPGLAKGRRKFLWASLFSASLVPLLIMMTRAFSPNKKLR